jgi:hypothetical protein
MILGYRCQEYHYNDESTESKTWITKDLKLNSRGFFDALFNIGATMRGIRIGKFDREISRTFNLEKAPANSLE